MLQPAVCAAPGSSTIRSVPELKASGGQVIGSTARPRRLATGSGRSAVCTCAHGHPASHTISTPAPVLVVQFVAGRLADYQRVAGRLRAAEIGAEVYPEAKKLAAQFKYAEQRGFRVALIAGPDELGQGAWNVKDLIRKEEQKAVPEAGVVETVQKILSEPRPSGSGFPGTTP